MDKVVHFEIPADDMERAKKFYEEIFGWHIISMPVLGYNMIHTGPTDDKTGMVQEPAFINGGMFKRGAILTKPVVTISVKSLDESIKQIETHGGKVIQGKNKVGEMGYTAYFSDSEGNIVGLWEDIKPV